MEPCESSICGQVDLFVAQSDVSLTRDVRIQGRGFSLFTQSLPEALLKRSRRLLYSEVGSVSES